MRLRATARGARQDQQFDALRMTHCELLRDHPAEGHPHHEATLPAHGVEQAGHVLAVVFHRAGAVGPRAAAEAALVEGQHVEGAR